MEKELRFFRNTIVEKKRRVSKEHLPRRVFSLEECIFLSPANFQNNFLPIMVDFYIGDRVRFLGQMVTVREIIFDSEDTVFYRIEYDSGVQTFVSQEVLQEEKEVLERKAEFIRVRNFQPVPQKKMLQSSSLPIPQPQPTESLLPKLEAPKKEEWKQLDIKVEEIMKFLSLGPCRNDLEKLDNILRIYKFLVQNPYYDKAIVKEQNPNIPLESQENELLKKFFPSLAFQYLLEQVSIFSQIVVSLEGNNMHTSLLVSFDKKYNFFDIEKERKLGMCDFQMAGLGMDEYSSNYKILGIFPQEEEGADKLLSLPSNISKSRIGTMILKGYSRMIPDLQYSSKETVK